MLNIDRIALRSIGIGMFHLPDTKRRQQKMLVVTDAEIGQTSGDTGHRTTVEGENRASAVRGSDEARNATANACDAGHLGETFAIEPQRQLVGHLCCAGAA